MTAGCSTPTYSLNCATPGQNAKSSPSLLLNRLIFSMSVRRPSPKSGSESNSLRTPIVALNSMIGLRTRCGQCSSSAARDFRGCHVQMAAARRGRPQGWTYLLATRSHHRGDRASSRTDGRVPRCRRPSKSSRARIQSVGRSTAGARFHRIIFH